MISFIAEFCNPFLLASLSLVEFSGFNLDLLEMMAYLPIGKFTRRGVY
jgi:hypothetical protein